MILKAVALALGTTALVAAPAAAEGQGGSPWTPYHSSDYTVPAGAACSFALHQAVVVDRERYRTTEWFPDGSPRYEEWTGQLVIRYTNVDTGASARRVLNGRGDFEYFADGGLTLTSMGGIFGAALGPDDDPGAGYYIVQGRSSSVHLDADGHATLTIARGSRVENLCETLG